LKEIKTIVIFIVVFVFQWWMGGLIVLLFLFFFVLFCSFPYLIFWRFNQLGRSQENLYSCNSNY